MQQIIFTENQLSELEEQIANLLHETNQYITTITGIGDVLGAIIVSEIGDINRFERPNQLVAFAGLDVTVKASGKHHLTAVGAVARKLCNIIFVILKENRPYFPTPPKKSQNLS